MFGPGKGLGPLSHPDPPRFLSRRHADGTRIRQAVTQFHTSEPTIRTDDAMPHATHLLSPPRQRARPGHAEARSIPAAPPVAQDARPPALPMTLGCLAMLLLAQALIGVLSLSALNRQITDMTADRLEVAARQIGGRIENGCAWESRWASTSGWPGICRQRPGDRAPGRRGRPFIGWPRAGRRKTRRSWRAATAARPGRARHRRAAQGMTRRAGGALALRLPGSVTLATPLRDAAGVTQGAVILSTQRNTEASRALVRTICACWCW